MRQPTAQLPPLPLMSPDATAAVAATNEPLYFTLASGRKLAYTFYGAPVGAPNSVFYFHGFPGCRLEAALINDAATAQNVCLIVPDRPGMGSSPFQPDRRIIDWPADVLELADHLKIERFGVVGASGGSPYALACVNVIPRTRLSSAAICCGLFPASLGASGMLMRTRVLFSVAPWVPNRILTALFDFGIGKVVRGNDPAALEDMIKQDMADAPPADQECFNDEAFSKCFFESSREALRESSQGAAWEARLLGAHWGFELSDLDFDGLLLWHGAKDVNCPVTMARKAAKLIKGAELKEFENDGHISMVKRAGEIMGQMLSQCK